MNKYKETMKRRLLEAIRHNAVPHPNLWHRQRYPEKANAGMIIGGR